MGNLVEILPYHVAEHSASRMEHYTSHAIFILLYLYKMVSSAKRADRVISLLDKFQQFAVSIVSFYLTLRLIKHGRSLRLAVVTKTHRDSTEYISYYHLYKLTASCYSVTKNVHRDICLHKSHSTADVNAHCIWDNSIFAGYHAAYRHSLSCMRIRHQCDMVMSERKICKVYSLLETAFLDIAYRLCPYLDRNQHFIFIIIFKHFVYLLLLLLYVL